MSARRVLSCAMIVGLVGCSADEPTVIAPSPTPGPEPVAQGGAPIVGFVSLGRPVVGAIVTAVAFGNLRGGAELASASTDGAGLFILPISATYRGRILLRASGGRYSEVAGGFERHIRAEQALLLITNYDPDEAHDGRVVSGASTLATKLAVALEAAHHPADEAVASAEALLVKHLAGSLEFELQATLPIDLAQIWGRWPEATAALGLLHAGLSEMA